MTDMNDQQQRMEFLRQRDVYWKAVLREAFPGIKYPRPDSDPAHHISLNELDQGMMGRKRGIAKKAGIALAREYLSQQATQDGKQDPFAVAEGDDVNVDNLLKDIEDDDIRAQRQEEIELLLAQDLLIPWYERAEARFLEVIPYAKYIHELAGTHNRIGWFKYNCTHYEEWTAELMQETVFNIFK